MGPAVDRSAPRNSWTQSAEGTVVSTFHLEAGIALYHCSAGSYAETDWPAILRLYDAMLTIHRSPVYLLNRAIVVAEIEGPRAGIRALDEAGQEPALRHYHLLMPRSASSTGGPAIRPGPPAPRSGQTTDSFAPRSRNHRPPVVEVLVRVEPSLPAQERDLLE